MKIKSTQKKDESSHYLFVENSKLQWGIVIQIRSILDQDNQRPESHKRAFHKPGNFPHRIARGSICSQDSLSDSSQRKVQPATFAGSQFGVFDTHKPSLALLSQAVNQTFHRTWHDGN